MNDTNGLVNDLIGLFEIFDIYKLLLLVIGVVLIISLNAGLNKMSNSLMEKVPTKRFQILQFSTLLSFSLYIFGTIGLIIGVLQPPHEFMIAVGGTIAVALGFALKDIVASLVAGIMLLFDRPFRVGDRVSFGGTYGEIVSIGLRTVRLNTLDDNLVTIPNSRFITDIVSSGNSGELDMMVVTDFHVSLEADLEKARDLIEKVVVTSRYAYLKKPVSFTIEEVVVANYLAIRIRTKAYVLDVRYEKDLQTDLVMRVAQLFKQQGVERPYINNNNPLLSPIN